jgi:hypothetical protein
MAQMKQINVKKSINSTTHKGNATRTQPKQSANKTSRSSIIAPLDKSTNPGTNNIFLTPKLIKQLKEGLLSNPTSLNSA